MKKHLLNLISFLFSESYCFGQKADMNHLIDFRNRIGSLLQVYANVGFSVAIFKQKKNCFLITICIISSSSVIAQKTEDITIGYHYSFESEIYNSNRNLYISLPESYDTSNINYPVLYVLFPGASFNRAVITYEQLVGKNIPELIIVGIDNVNQWEEVFPFKIEEVPATGGGSIFLSFIRNEVIPFVNKEFRTDSLKILAGFSNSAMFANYLLTEKPDLFNAYLFSSPMISLGDNFVFNATKEFFKKTTNLNKVIYITYSKNDYDQVLKPMPAYKELFEKSAPVGLKWNIVPKDDVHVPFTDMYDGLIFIFENFKMKQL